MVHTMLERPRLGEKILLAMEQGAAEPRNLETLQFQTRFLAPGNTFCAFAPGAMEPLQSAIKYFADDFQRHVNEKRCPWRYYGDYLHRKRTVQADPNQNLLQAACRLDSIFPISAGIRRSVRSAPAGSAR